MGLLSYGCSRFRCELNWNSVMILRRVEIRKKPGEKPPRAREITIRNLNLHVTTTPGFEPIGKSHLTAAPICMGLRTRILIFFFAPNSSISACTCELLKQPDIFVAEIIM